MDDDDCGAERAWMTDERERFEEEQAQLKADPAWHEWLDAIDAQSRKEMNHGDFSF